LIFNSEILEGKLDIYFDVLKDHPIEHLEHAFFEYYKQGKYFPMPVDIIKIIDNKFGEPWWVGL